MATSSSLSKAQYASVFSAVLGVGSLVAPLFVDASVVYLAVGGLSVLCSILAMTFIWKAHFSVGRIVETANAVSKGDFEARTICLGEGGDLGQLSNAVNELIDRTDAYVRETAAAMSYVADNRYNRKIVEKGMVGAFLRGATIINRAIEQTDHKVQAFRKVADNFEATMGEVARALASASGGLGDSATSIDAEARDTGSQAQIATSSTHEAAESVERVAAATEEQAVRRVFADECDVINYDGPSLTGIWGVGNRSLAA